MSDARWKMSDASNNITWRLSTADTSSGLENDYEYSWS